MTSLTLVAVTVLAACGDDAPGPGGLADLVDDTAPASAPAPGPPPTFDTDDIEDLQDLLDNRFDVTWRPVGAAALVDIGGTEYRFPLRVDGWSSCSVLFGGEDAVVITDFKLTEDRTNADNFAFTADESRDMVVWGLYDHGTGEEWSGEVSRPATLRSGHIDEDGRPVSGTGTTPWLVVGVEWNGEASENFSSQRHPSTVEIGCLFARTPAG